MSLLDTLPVEKNGDSWPELEAAERLLCRDLDSARAWLRDPRLARLLNYWEELRGDAELPMRSAIDPVDLQDLLGWVLLMDWPEPGTFRFRLFGSRIADFYGIDLTGKTIRDFGNPRATRFVAERMWEVIDRRIPIATRSVREIQGRNVLVERLDLPFAGEDGKVGFVMTGLMPIARTGSVGHSRRAV